MKLSEKQKWEPIWFAEVNEQAEDGDYLRTQGCCTSCGANIDTIPGYYYLEDCDECPKCREAQKSEKWSTEVKRVTKGRLAKEDRKELMTEISKLDI